MNNSQLIESVMLKGDLSVLNQNQKVEYYAKVCESVGLNPLTKPLEYIKLNGKEVLYATKGATEQLRNIHGISLKIVARDKIEDVYVVTAEATGKDGRCDSATGAVAVGGLKGDALANAFMKAETKAKRRVTLSICGLNMLDESEVESIPQAKKIENVVMPKPILDVNQAIADRKIVEVMQSNYQASKSKPLDSDVSYVPEPSNANHGYQQQSVNSDFDNFLPGATLDSFNQAETLPADNGDYVCKIGKKYVGMTLNDMGVETVRSFAAWIRKSDQEKGKQSQGDWAEFLEQADIYCKGKV